MTKSNDKSCNNVPFLGVVYEVVITQLLSVTSAVNRVVSAVNSVVSAVKRITSLGLLYTVVGCTRGVNTVFIIGLDILFIY